MNCQEFNEQLTTAARNFIEQAMRNHDLSGYQAKDAISEATFLSIGYTESMILEEARKRMEPTRFEELKRIVMMRPQTIEEEDI